MRFRNSNSNDLNLVIVVALTICKYVLDRHLQIFRGFLSFSFIISHLLMRSNANIELPD